MSEHWPPAVGELIVDETRKRYHLHPYGQIVIVDHHCEDALIRFKGKTIEHRQGVVVIDGIQQPDVLLLEHPEYGYKGGDLQQYTFDELENCWESSDGGAGCWKITDDEADTD